MESKAQTFPVRNIFGRITHGDHRKIFKKVEQVCPFDAFTDSFKRVVGATHKTLLSVVALAGWRLSGIFGSVEAASILK